MGIFDGDPRYQELKRIREKEGYKGWLDQDNKKVSDKDVKSGAWKGKGKKK
jgi:hypothetical protein